MSGKEKNCNYQDNIFFINEIIRRTSSAVALEIEPIYWKDYILKDLGFLLKVLEELFANLKANTLLITRLNSLNDLKKSFSLFANLLDTILSGAYPICTSISPDKPKISLMSQRASELLAETKEMVLEESKKSMQNDHETVSENEYKFLFSEEETNP